DALGGVAHWAFVAMLGALAPVVLATAAAGVLGNIVQVRPNITTSALKPSFSRLNPLAGFKRLFSPHSLVETAKSILKLLVIGGITFFAVYPKLQGLGALVGLPPSALLPKIGGMVLSIAYRAMIPL